MSEDLIEEIELGGKKYPILSSIAPLIGDSTPREFVQVPSPPIVRTPFIDYMRGFEGTFLDTGSAWGHIVVIAGALGAKSRGIELDSKVFAFSEITMEKARVVNPSIDVAVANGSYYSRDFDEKLRRDSMFGNSVDHLYERDGVRKPYDDLGMQFGEFDRHFHFQVGAKEIFLEYFARNAKSGAELFYVASRDDQFPTLDAITVKKIPSESSSCYLVKKK